MPGGEQVDRSWRLSRRVAASRAPMPIVNRRTLMSSSIRWRSGLMGLSLIRVSRLEVRVLDPSILKTERPLRHPRLITWLLAFRPYPQPRCPRPPARAGSFGDPKRTPIRLTPECRGFALSPRDQTSLLSYLTSLSDVARGPRRANDNTHLALVPLFSASHSAGSLSAREAKTSCGN